MTRRVNIRAILANPTQCRDLMIGVICFLQNIEGINTTREQAATAYDTIQQEKTP